MRVDWGSLSCHDISRMSRSFPCCSICPRTQCSRGASLVTFTRGLCGYTPFNAALGSGQSSRQPPSQGDSMLQTPPGRFSSTCTEKTGELSARRGGAGRAHLADSHEVAVERAHGPRLLGQAVRAVHVRRLRGEGPVHQRAHGHLQRPAQPLHARLLVRRIAAARRAAWHVASAGHARCSTGERQCQAPSPRITALSAAQRPHLDTDELSQGVLHMTALISTPTQLTCSLVTWGCSATQPVCSVTHSCASLPGCCCRPSDSHSTAWHTPSFRPRRKLCSLFSANAAALRLIRWDCLGGKLYSAGALWRK